MSQRLILHTFDTTDLEKSNSIIKQKARHYFLVTALCEQEGGDDINLPAGNQ